MSVKYGLCAVYSGMQKVCACPTTVNDPECIIGCTEYIYCTLYIELLCLRCIKSVQYIRAVWPEQHEAADAHTHTQTHMQTHSCTHTHNHTYACTRTHTHTHTHTHTDRCTHFISISRVSQEALRRQISNEWSPIHDRQADAIHKMSCYGVTGIRLTLTLCSQNIKEWPCVHTCTLGINSTYCIKILGTKQSPSSNCTKSTRSGYRCRPAGPMGYNTVR